MHLKQVYNLDRFNVAVKWNIISSLHLDGPRFSLVQNIVYHGLFHCFS